MPLTGPFSSNLILKAQHSIKKRWHFWCNFLHLFQTPFWKGPYMVEVSMVLFHTVNTHTFFSIKKFYKCLAFLFQLVACLYVPVPVASIAISLRMWNNFFSTTLSLITEFYEWSEVNHDAFVQHCFLFCIAFSKVLSSCFL